MDPAESSDANSTGAALPSSAALDHIHAAIASLVADNRASSMLHTTITGPGSIPVGAVADLPGGLTVGGLVVSQRAAPPALGSPHAAIGDLPGGLTDPATLGSPHTAIGDLPGGLTDPATLGSPHTAIGLPSDKCAPVASRMVTEKDAPEKSTDGETGSVDVDASSTQLGPVVDPDEGWTKVKPRKSRKYRMRRGVNPNVVTPDPPVLCEIEVPWGPMSGGYLRKIRKWYQTRRSGLVMTAFGQGRIIYGSFGPYGLEF